MQLEKEKKEKRERERCRALAQRIAEEAGRRLGGPAGRADALC